MSGWEKPLCARPFFWEMVWRRSVRAGEAAGQWLADALRRQPWVAERLAFFQAWRADPRTIGAIAPSSARLARAMTRHVRPGKGSVIELGAGTGVFTRALVARGVRPDDLTLVETDPQFVQRLRHEFPGAHVLAMDASRLAGFSDLDSRAAAVAICGIPLLNLPLKTRIGILRGTFTHLQAAGAFYFFTYGLHCPIPQRVLDHLRLRATKQDVVLANVPPAHVWCVTRRGGRN